MTSPKEALEKIAKFYPEHPAWCSAKIAVDESTATFAKALRQAHQERFDDKLPEVMK